MAQACGRRVARYALVRLLRPGLVVETGVDQGVGVCVLAAALLRNAAEGHPGRYIGAELRRGAGACFCGRWAAAGEVRYGDTLDTLAAIDRPIDLFVNDSDHSADHEAREYAPIRDKLSETAVVIGDNAHATDRLSCFARETGRQFLFAPGVPLDHWNPGAGVGLCFPDGGMRAMRAE